MDSPNLSPLELAVKEHVESLEAAPKRTPLQQAAVDAYHFLANAHLDDLDREEARPVLAALSAAFELEGIEPYDDPPNEEPDRLYRIRWRSLSTGATGHGTGGFPKPQAEAIVRQLDEEYPGLRPWIEPVPLDDVPPVNTADASEAFSGAVPVDPLGN